MFQQKSMSCYSCLVLYLHAERKHWGLYWRVSELLLSPKEGWRRMKWTLYAEVQRPKKRASSWEVGLRNLIHWWICNSKWFFPLSQKIHISVEVSQWYLLAGLKWLLTIIQKNKQFSQIRKLSLGRHRTQ